MAKTVEETKSLEADILFFSRQKPSVEKFDTISDGLNPMEDELSRGFIDLNLVYKIIES